MNKLTMTPAPGTSSSSSCSTGSISFSSISSIGEPQLKAEPDSLSRSLPPSESLLHRVAQWPREVEPPQMSSFAALPTMLIHLVMNWLVRGDKENLLLISHHVHDEVQERYRPLLRETVAERSASLMASYRNTVNRRPEYLQMGPLGETIFNWSLKNRKLASSEAAYTRAVLNLFNKQKNFHETDSLRSLTVGIGLALGGTFMTTANRDAWLACILGSSGTSTAEQMESMIRGVCNAGGHTKISSKYLQAVLRRILTSYATSSPTKMAAMMRALCAFLGNRMMSADNRDGLLKTILNVFKVTRNIPALVKPIHALCVSLGGRDMSSANRDALVAQNVGLYAVGNWSVTEVAAGIVSLCEELGGAQMTSESLDSLLAGILACHTTSSPELMRNMITSLCYALGNAISPVPNLDLENTGITQVNLAEVVDRILASHSTCSNVQMGAMIFGVFTAVGGIDMMPMCRAVLVAGIEKSGRVQEIVNALQLSTGGQAVLDFLQIETAEMTDESPSI